MTVELKSGGGNGSLGHVSKCNDPRCGGVFKSQRDFNKRRRMCVSHSFQRHSVQWQLLTCTVAADQLYTVKLLSGIKWQLFQVPGIHICTVQYKVDLPQSLLLNLYWRVYCISPTRVQWMISDERSPQHKHTIKQT